MDAIDVEYEEEEEAMTNGGAEEISAMYNSNEMDYDEEKKSDDGEV